MVDETAVDGVSNPLKSFLLPLSPSYCLSIVKISFGTPSLSLE
jgi:hypothetical protein